MNGPERLAHTGAVSTYKNPRRVNWVAVAVAILVVMGLVVLALM